jgi:hypothetical protein
LAATCPISGPDESEHLLVGAALEEPRVTNMVVSGRIGVDLVVSRTRK